MSKSVLNNKRNLILNENEKKLFLFLFIKGNQVNILEPYLWK